MTDGQTDGRRNRRFSIGVDNCRRRRGGVGYAMVLAVIVGESFVSMCCSSEKPLPPVGKRGAEEVTLTQLISAPGKFDRTRVRVIGMCAIAFEGNALYLSEAERRQPSVQSAIWLQLGWPVSPEIRALNGSYVLVEGRFDSESKGHEGIYQGAIAEITRVEKSSKEAEAETARRLTEGR